MILPLPLGPEDLKPHAVAHHLTCRVFSLCQVEKRLELVKQVSHSTHKKLTACLQGQQGVDVDKKSVRSPSVSSRSATFDHMIIKSTEASPSPEINSTDWVGGL